jgi:hypothetical protein
MRLEEVAMSTVITFAGMSTEEVKMSPQTLEIILPLRKLSEMMSLIIVP